MPEPGNMRLRPIEEKDLELILSWRNSERVRAYMYTDHIITAEEHREWFKRLQAEVPPRSLLFEADGRPLGVVNVTHWDQGNRSCHWGFYLGETDAPGSGTKMAYLALRYIFETLKVRKVIGEAFAFNEGSVAYHRKLGFHEEGRFVRHVLKGGEYRDVISFALFEEDWPRVQEELERKISQYGTGL